ncbi:MAG TPA: TraB/GumN family protein [Flavobacterium sp.]|nr:TraB/GumN family protein [Flavobacterium sp.]
MKKLLILCLSFLGLMASAQPKGLLWKITSPKFEKPSYLYGTIHITCDASLAEATKKALSETEKLFLELDMDDPALQMTMMQHMRMSGGKTLKSLLSEGDFKLLDDYMKRNLGMSAVLVNTVKPFMISAMFYPKMIECPMQSVEQELMKLSAQSQKEILGLETVTDQLAIFDAIPYEVQLEELIKSVKNDFVNDKAETAKLYESYATQDVELMYKLATESQNKLTSEYDDVLLDKRNKSWIPVIETQLQKQPSFFAVGAAHLGGPNGVINLLRKAGYVVEVVGNQ